MEQINFHFVVYAVDQRPIDQVRVAIEQSIGCQFAQERADRPSDELRERFEMTVMGIYISFRPAGDWPEGRVYRLGGGSDPRIRIEGGTEVPIDSHIGRLLKRAGVDRVLSRLEHAARARELGP